MNVTNKISLICISCLLLSFLSFGQKKNKAQLVKDKKENLQKIKEAETILSATQTKKNYTMGQLSAVSEQITIRAVPLLGAGIIYLATKSTRFN